MINFLFYYLYLIINNDYKKKIYNKSLTGFKNKKKVKRNKT